MNMLSFLAGPSGKTSSMRVNAFLVLIVALFLSINSQLSSKPMPELSPEWLGLILGAMGIQVWHKNKENGKERNETAAIRRDSGPA